MDKRQQYALIHRKRGELAKALREGLGRLNKMGIKSDIYVPKGKDNVAYLLIDENDLCRFFQRKVTSRIRKLSNEIQVKSGIIDDVLATKIIADEVNIDEDINKDIDKVKNELNNMKIRTEIFVDTKEYTTLTFLMNINDIVNYFDNQIKDTISKRRIKVSVATYRENGVLVIRFTK